LEENGAHPGGGGSGVPATRRPFARRRCRRTRAACTLLGLSVALAACGGGERQDEDEPKGEFKVEVLEASFPAQQKLAKRSILELVVRNADTRDVPNIAVTLNGFEKRRDDPDLADPRRPQFVINGRGTNPGGIQDAEEAGPRNGVTSYVNTWALGKLRPGETRSFKWDVTAAEAGPYRLQYVVSAGLDGKARAVDPTGAIPKGVFAGRVTARPPRARIADDGQTVIRE
jgi:hypothetical protein